MFDCIIFDLDGTLVDSEPLCNQAFLNLLPELLLPVDDLIVRFRGRKLAEILEDIEHLIGHKLPAHFESAYRAQVETLFNSSLETFPNVHDALKNIGIPFCIASSGPQQKIVSALKKTRLDSLFIGHVFSSYDIGKWKPDPSLFLHAAMTMGVPSHTCLVVEDSPVGILAAKTAGMTPLQFNNGETTILGVETFDAYCNFVEKVSALAKEHTQPDS